MELRRKMAKSPFWPYVRDARRAFERRGGSVNLPKHAAHDFDGELIARHLLEHRQLLALHRCRTARRLPQLAHAMRESSAPAQAEENVRICFRHLAA
jgi:hypothetical protein